MWPPPMGIVSRGECDAVITPLAPCLRAYGIFVVPGSLEIWYLLLKLLARHSIHSSECSYSRSDAKPPKRFQNLRHLSPGCSRLSFREQKTSQLHCWVFVLRSKERWH